MNEICGDNRFEIIAKAKADLLEGTNIETDEAEMAVLDNILFRCWQMGWLDRYDRKTDDIAEAYLRGWNNALDAVKNGKFVLKTEQKMSEISTGSEPQTDCPWK